MRSMTLWLAVVIIGVCDADSDFIVELLQLRKEDNKKLYPSSSWVFPASSNMVNVGTERASRLIVARLLPGRLPWAL